MRPPVLLDLPGLFVRQLPLRHKIVRDIRERFAGQENCPLKRIQRDGNDLPHAFEITKARVREKQRDRKKTQKREP